MAGTEFTGQAFQALLKKRKIHHYIAHNEKHANYGERFIRTLKSRLFRYMAQKNTYKYIDILQDVVKSYNYTPHRGLGRAPIEVNPRNQDEVRLEQYMRKPYKKYTKKKYRFKIGDYVRLVDTTHIFDRDWGMRWTGEESIFFIVVI